jgi:hypothetical protein
VLGNVPAMGTQQPNPNQFNNRFTGQEMSVHINFFAHCQTGQIDNHMVLSGHKILEAFASRSQERSSLHAAEPYQTSTFTAN